MRKGERQKTIENLKGEVRFRELLYEQHIEGREIFDDEYDQEGIYKILVDGCEKSERQFRKLKKENLLKQPYLEIGAEKCHRALIANNKFGLTGVAADISYHSLKAGTYLATRMGLSDIPLRICCDLNNMPFKGNSFPFIFCYATLHHFPDPSSILKEIKRVLMKGGCFFFDEEPVKRKLKLHMYKQANKIYDKKVQNRKRCLRVIEAIISDASCNEEEFGIIENQDVNIRHWEKALSVFDKVETTISREFRFFPEFRYQNNVDGIAKRVLKKSLFSLIGGGISALCFKDPGTEVRESPMNVGNLPSYLRCPECAIRQKDSNLQYSNSQTLLCCESCGMEFPKKEGIFFLLNKKSLEDLYPKIAKETERNV